MGHRRYIWNDETRKFIKTVAATSKHRRKTIKKGTTLWRAALGNSWRYDHDADDEVPVPHDVDRMTPFPDKAKEGRVNPKGIPCLYLASSKEIAMSETRPWVGSKVSVMAFSLRKDQQVIDCTMDSDHAGVIFFDEPDDARKEQSVWSHINQAFSLPVSRSDDIAEYVPTQIIAETFKNEGVDGLIYGSVFDEKGFNVALFDPRWAQPVEARSFVYQARTATFEYKQIF